MCITSHLSTLKLIFATCFPTQQGYWYLNVVPLWLASGFRALCQIFVSPANLDILLTILVSRSFIYVRNSCGPNTLPCGTTDVIGAQLLLDRLMHTRWRRPANHFRIHLSASPWMPCALTFCISLSCGTLANAFWKSRETKFTDLLLSVSNVFMTLAKKSSRLSGRYVCFGCHMLRVTYQVVHFQVWLVTP